MEQPSNSSENLIIEANEHPFIGKHCVVRTYSAGVHLGSVESVDGSQCILSNARRLWKWGGAFTLSEVSKTGLDPEKSRIADEVDLISLSDMIELIPTTSVARDTFGACNEE